MLLGVMSVLQCFMGLAVPQQLEGHNLKTPGLKKDSKTHSDQPKMVFGKTEIWLTWVTGLDVPIQYVEEQWLFCGCLCFGEKSSVAWKAGRSLSPSTILCEGAKYSAMTEGCP